MNDQKRDLIRDWNERPIVTACSKGGVMALANVDDHLLKPDGIPWPPAPVVQKLYRSRQQSAFDDQARAVLTKRLGYYCDLQSVHSEDAMTWNYFGPLMAASEPERVRFVNWLQDRLEPGATPNRVCGMDLWRRIPHPDNLVPGGPEIDFLVVGDRSVIFGEAKWNAAEGKGQGLDGDKTQLQLRSKFLHELGGWVYRGRKFYVLIVTLEREEGPVAYHPSVSVRRLTWHDLCAYSQHPVHDEVCRYYHWKRQHSR